jgi:Bacterial PH domain
LILNKLEITYTDKLETDGYIYGKKVPLNDIQKNGIIKVDLLKDDNFKPRVKLNGIGVKGFYSGWFKLNNGNKALVNITKEDEAVFIPMKDYDVLISVQDADRFISELRK